MVSVDLGELSELDYFERDREGSNICAVESALIGGVNGIIEGGKSVLEADGASDGSRAVRERVGQQSDAS